MGLFMEPADASHFVELLGFAERKHAARFLAYGLGANRAELLVQTPEANLSEVMQGIQTSLARYLRHHYVLKGAVMQGRFHSRLVEAPKAIPLAAARVITLPLREKDRFPGPEQAKKQLKSSNLSSFPALSQTDVEFPSAGADILKALAGAKNSRLQRFEALCMQVMYGASLSAGIEESSIALGRPEFLAEIEAKHEALRKGKRVQGVTPYGRKRAAPGRKKVLDAVLKEFDAQAVDLKSRARGSWLRGAAAYALYRYGKLPQREIAALLGLTTAAAVSLQIKRLLLARETLPDLDKRLKALETTLG